MINENESRVAAEIRLSVEYLRSQQFESQQDYDDAVKAQECWLSIVYGVRPGTLLALRPYFEGAVNTSV